MEEKKKKGIGRGNKKGGGDNDGTLLHSVRKSNSFLVVYC